MSNFEERFHPHVGSIRAKTLVEQALDWRDEHILSLKKAENSLKELQEQRMPRYLMEALSDEAQRIKDDRLRCLGDRSQSRGATQTDKNIPDWATGKAWREASCNFQRNKSED